MLVDLRKNWLTEIVCVAALALITLAVWKGWTASLDEGVRSFVLSHQVGAVWWVARILNFLGQGWLVCWLLGGGATLALLIRTRHWKPLLPWVMVFAMTYLTIGPLKVWTHRAAPSNDNANRVEMFNPLVSGAKAMSYPSGHVVNAIIWWTLIAMLAAILVPRWSRHIAKLIVIAPVVVVLTTTYLNHHWLTDGMAAVALGVLLYRLFNRVNWAAILPPASRA